MWPLCNMCHERMLEVPESHGGGFVCPHGYHPDHHMRSDYDKQAIENMITAALNLADERSVEDRQHDRDASDFTPIPPALAPLLAVTGRNVLDGGCIDCGFHMSTTDGALPLRCHPCAAVDRVTNGRALMVDLMEAWSKIPDAALLPMPLPWLKPLVDAVTRIVAPDHKVQPTEGIDFISALASGKPMRRMSWMKRPPIGDDKQADQLRKLEQHWWLYLRPMPQLVQNHNGGDPLHLAPWINVITGYGVTLTRDDYCAGDWEIMP